MRIITFILFLLIIELKANAQILEDNFSKPPPNPDAMWKEEKEQFDIDPEKVYNKIVLGDYTYFRYKGKNNIYRYDTVSLNSEKRIAKKSIKSFLDNRITDMILVDSVIYFFEIGWGGKVWTLSNNEVYFKASEGVFLSADCIFVSISSKNDKIFIALKCDGNDSMVEYSR